MTAEALTAYLVQAFLAWAPPHCAPNEVPAINHCRVYKSFPENNETREELTSRYAVLGSAIATVVFDENEKPIVEGEFARERTGVLLGSVALWESGLRRDVMLNLGKWARGDSGMSWSPWQIYLDRSGVKTTAEGWTGPELIDDPSKAARVALHKLQSAVATCPGSLADRFTLYRYGSCRPAEDQERSRLGTAERWVRAHPFETASEV